MRIAIHAADLDNERIDGTRVYLLNMLKNFGKLDKQAKFTLYHRNDFNHQLTPPSLKNYLIKKIPFPIFWTQTRLAWQLFWDRPDVLWMPLHNMPILRRKKLKVVVTIHDLAFKIFPQYFPKKELAKLNRLTDCAIKNADGIIAVSQATRNDILKFYPGVSAGKIKVIHHGFDTQLFKVKKAKIENSEILSKFKIQNSKFILYVGAIQPRKNLIVLIEAFEQIKKNQPELKLVLAGAPAWNFKETLERIKGSIYAEDIRVTGKVPFESLVVFYRNASAFIFPSIYEGFGIPVLEAMASGTPTIIANNSSLPEVGGKAALYFNASSSQELAACVARVLSDEALRAQMIAAGLRQVQKFSWEKCAQETLEFISFL